MHLYTRRRIPNEHISLPQTRTRTRRQSQPEIIIPTQELTIMQVSYLDKTYLLMTKVLIFMLSQRFHTHLLNMIINVHETFSVLSNIFESHLFPK